LFGDEELSEKGMGEDCDDLSEGEMVLNAAEATVWSHWAEQVGNE
jgi:hypothetical protein